MFYSVYFDRKYVIPHWETNECDEETLSEKCFSGTCNYECQARYGLKFAIQTEAQIEVDRLNTILELDWKETMPVLKK